MCAASTDFITLDLKTLLCGWRVDVMMWLAVYGIVRLYYTTFVAKAILFFFVVVKQVIRQQSLKLFVPT